MRKFIKGFEGIYSVTDDGEVWSHKTGESVRLKGGWCGKYRSYSLRKDGEQTQHLGHRLIAQSFIDNPDGKPEVNHIDGNKSNNAVDNLEWVTKSENSKHAYATGLITNIDQDHLNRMRNNAGKARAVFTEVHADNIRAIHGVLGVSCRKIAKAYKCHPSTIQRIVNGTTKIFREAA